MSRHTRAHARTRTHVRRSCRPQLAVHAGSVVCAVHQSGVVFVRSAPVCVVRGEFGGENSNAQRPDQQRRAADTYPVSSMVYPVTFMVLGLYSTDEDGATDQRP